MPAMKTLLLDLGQVDARLLGGVESAYTATVSVCYDRDVDVTGEVRVPAGVPIFAGVVGDEVPSVEVVPSDSEQVAAVARGFGVVVVAELSPRASARGGLRSVRHRWVVQVTESDPDTVRLSSRAPVEPAAPPVQARVLTVNGQAPDGSGNIVVEGAGGEGSEGPAGPPGPPGPSGSGAAAVRALPRWAVALATQDQAPAKCVVLGDSILEGWFTDGPIAQNRALGRFRAALNTGTVGAGDLPALYVGDFLEDEGDTSHAPSTAVGAECQIRYDQGLGLKVLRLNSKPATGQPWKEWTFTGDRCRIWYVLEQYAASGVITIDGVEVASPSGVGPQGSVSSWTSDVLPRGEHTVRVTVASGLDDFPFNVERFEAFDGDADRGVRVYDGCHYGYATTDFNAQLAWRASLSALAPHLVVIALGVNDSSSKTAAVFKANLTTLVGHVRSALQSSTYDLAVVSLYERQDTPGPVEPWAAYVDAAREVAEAEGALHVDVREWWADDAGLVSDFDGVHTTQAGQVVLGHVLARTLGG